MLNNNSNLENKTDEFKNILKKYYKNVDIDNLYNKIEQEIAENTGTYKIPKSSIEMLNLAIDLLKNNSMTNEEEVVVRYILEEIDTTFIEDDNLVKELEKLNIPID